MMVHTFKICTFYFLHISYIVSHFWGLELSLFFVQNLACYRLIESSGQRSDHEQNICQEYVLFTKRMPRIG